MALIRKPRPGAAWRPWRRLSGSRNSSSTIGSQPIRNRRTVPLGPIPSRASARSILETIRAYIDEIHRRGGRAWACVQAVGAQGADLANPSAGIYPLLDRDGKQYRHSPEMPRFWAYFLNEAWAERMTDVWAPAVKDLGFDGIHWDTLGPKAGDYGAEVNGTHAFLRRAKGNLADLGLSQTLNFVDLAWWDPGLVANGLV